MKWADEVKGMLDSDPRVDILCVVDGTVFIHKPVKATILAHSAIKITEDNGYFEIQAMVVIRSGDEHKITRRGIPVGSYYLDEEHSLATFSTGTSSLEKLKEIVDWILEISI